jgi:trk system potassium uptake protein TrkH
VRALRIDDAVVEHEEIQRAGALFFAWVALIAIGGIATAALTRHGALESFSGMVSAVSNIGPCYISATGLMQLPASVKLIHIFGMLAGRLEILPVLMLFNRRAWT